MEGHGTIGLASAAGFPIDIQLQFQNARLARSDDLSAPWRPAALAIVNDRSGASISGTLDLGEARYQIVRQAAAEVPQLAGVRRRGEPLRPPNEQNADKGVPSIWRLDIRLNANNRVYVSGMGLDSEWRADLRVEGTTATPQIAGRVDLIRGELGLAGRRFRLTEGHVAFTGERPPNPTIDLAATSDIDQVTVGLNVSGRSNNPQIAFTSSPGLPQDEIVSRILFGSSVTQISALQAVQLAASLNFAARQRRRPQSARPAAVGDRHRPAAPRRRRHRDRPRHRGRRGHVPFRQHLCRDHHRRQGLHRHPARNLAVADVEPALAIRLEQRDERQPQIQSGLLGDGAQGRDRTTDTVIFSHVLYQLSYLGLSDERGSQRL